MCYHSRKNQKEKVEKQLQLKWRKPTASAGMAFCCDGMEIECAGRTEAISLTVNVKSCFIFLFMFIIIIIVCSFISNFQVYVMLNSLELQCSKRGTVGFRVKLGTLLAKRLVFTSELNGYL